jgi:hypothetical protein
MEGAMRRSLLVVLLTIAAGLGSGREARAHGYPYGPYPYGPCAWGVPWWPGYVAVPACPPPVGFLDLDVAPEEAEVIIAGAVAGIADNFDGFPDYLAVRPGTRTLTFKHPGYQDLRIKVHVTPGFVHRIRRNMTPLPKARSGN